MLIPTAFIADKSKKKKVTPVSKEEQAKAFDILKRQTEKEKASEQGFIQDQLIAQDEAIQRQRAGLNTPKPKSYTEITVPTPATPVAPTVKTTPEGLVKKTFNTKYGVVDYVADERESKIFKGTDVNAINNLTKDIVQYFEGLGRDQGRKPIVKNTREKYTFDEVNAGLNPNFVEEETRKGVKQFEDATLGKLDVLGVRARLNELADYAKQSDSTLGQVAGGFVEAIANPMTTFAMSTGNIVDPNATLEERGGAALNLALAAIPIGQFAGAATAGASAFKQGLSSGLRNAIKVGAREYAKDTLFGNLALREITLDSVVRQLRNAGEVEGNVLRFKNDLRKEAKRSGVNPSDYLKNKFQEAEVTVEPSIPSPTQVIQETEQPVVATANPVIDEALKTADEITNQAPTTGNSAIDEAFKVEQEIAEQATPKLIDETIVKTEPVIFPTEITESDLEKLFQETIAPTLVPAKATKTTKTRKVETEVTEPAPVINQESNAIVNEVSAQPESVAVQESIATPEPVVSKPITNTTPEELANSNVSVTQVPFKLDWTSKESAERSMDYLNSLRNKFRESGESGIENIDDLPLLSVSYLHQWHINNFKSSPINNKTLLPKSVYQKSIEELTYGEFKNMDWRLVPDTKENQPLISLLKQREKAFNKMITYIKENPKGGVSNAWDNYRQILASRNNVVNPNDTELMDALWQAFKTDDVIDANVELNRLFGTWYDPKENKLFPPAKRTGSRSPNRKAVEQFVDAQEEALQRLAKESKNKSLGNNRQRGAYVPPTKAELEFVARSVAYVIGKTGLKLDDALIETSKYLKQKFNFDVTFNSEYIEDIKKELEKINIPTNVVPTSQAIKVPVSSAMQAEQPPVPPTQTATTAIPEPDTQQFSGISNRAFDESEIAGRLESAPGSNGKSAKEIYERNRNRDDYLLLADRIANKEIGITADNIAAIHAGGTKLERNVEDAIQAVKNAISRGASEQEIAQLIANRDNARKVFKEYADKVQKGKSEWSDIGRVIALRTELDTGNITRVLDELETIKGKTLTDDEIQKWTDIVEKHKAENEKLKKQIEDLQTKNANVTPDVIKADAQVQAIKKSTPKVRPKQTPDSKQKLQNALDNAISKLNGIARPQTLETLGANLEPKFFENFMSDPATQSYFQELSNAQSDVSKVINNLLETEAIEDYGTLLTRLQEEGLNITDTDLKLILSGEYPKPIKLIDPSDIEKEYLKVVRSQLQKESKTSSVAERSRLIKKIQRINEDIRTNVKPGERAKPTTFKENEDLRKRLDDLKKQYNEKNQDEILRIQLKQRNEREAIKSQLEAERPKELVEKLENIAVQIKLANPIPRIADYLSNQLVKADKIVSDVAFNKMVGAGFERLTGQQAIENFARGERKVRIDRVKERAKIRAKANLELIKDGISELGTEKFGGKGIGTQAAALTDLPFKAYWEEYGIDVFADDKARKLLKKDNIPLTKESIAKKRDEIINNLDEHPDVEINAQNYALNKTFNNDNWASGLQNFATRNASKGQKFLLNETLFRFSKVITNIGIDALDRTGYGVLRGIQKAIKGKGNLSPAESLIITDMIKKGLTGVALQTLGYYLGDKISAEIKGDRLKYVDFGLLNRVGGVLSPFLLGVSLRKTLDSDMDENSKRNLYLSTGIKMVSNNPLASNLRDILELTNSSTPSTILPEYVGKKTSNVLIPGIVRDSATQIDEIANADAQRKKYEKDAGAFDIVKGEFQSKIPFWRQQLPLKNQKVGRPDE